MVRRCLDSYFEYTDLADCMFLHKASTMTEWNKGVLDHTLLKAICAHGLRNMSPQHREEGSVPHLWMQQVRDNLSGNFWTTNIADLQALMLVVKFEFTCRFTEEVLILLSVAARMAFMKRLNYESTLKDAVQKECLRRLMWSIFMHDKIFSGGLEDLSVCPANRLQIRLPSNDYCFQRGLSSRSQFINDTASVEMTDMDSTAYRLRLMDIRDRILR